MRVSGICAVCSGTAGNTCMLCGRLVCDRHYDTARHTCSSCKGKRLKRSQSMG